MRDKKSTFCKLVELEALAYRTTQLTMAAHQIVQGTPVTETEQVDMTAIQCVDEAWNIPEHFIPDNYAEAAFTYCRWFLYEKAEPTWVMEMRNTKEEDCVAATRVYIFSKLHFITNIFEAGEYSERVYVDHCYFTDEDLKERQYTFAVKIIDPVSLMHHVEKYSRDWPDAVIVGNGNIHYCHIEEIQCDEKNNYVLDMIGGKHSDLVKAIVNKNASKVHE